MDRLELLIQQWQTRESKVKSNLIPIKDDQLIRQVIEVLGCFKRNLTQLIEYGEEHDYDSAVKYNGFRSFVKISGAAIARVEQTLAGQSGSEPFDVRSVQKCVSFLQFMNKINRIVLETYKKNQSIGEQDVNQNRKECSLLFDEQMTCDLYTQYFAMKEDLKIYLDGHMLFYLNKQMRTLVRSVSTLLSLFSYFPLSLFILFSKERKLNVITNAIVDATISWPGSVEIVNKPLVCYIYCLLANFRNKIQSETVFIPKQQKWQLKSLDECNADTTATASLFHYRPDQPAVGGQQAKRQPLATSELKKNGVRIRLIHHASRPTMDGVVMFHVHGGAFIYHSPDCHEVYLHKFVEEIPNLYIFSVDYKLREKYGSGHQDVLDAYLWLTSDSPDVEALFGFKPKRILICGDSAGAFLSFTLCSMLKDLQKYVDEQKLNETIVLPDTLINFYGFTTLNKLSPSMILTFMECIVNLPVLRTGFGSLLFGCEKPRLAKRIFMPFRSDRKERWYSSSNPKFDEYNQQFVDQIQKHPYLEPIDHVDFEELKDIRLYLVTCEFDVFLDMNVELAKKWKGFVHLEVFDDACHGFLNFSLIDPISRKAVDSSIQLVKDAIAASKPL